MTKFLGLAVAAAVTCVVAQPASASLIYLGDALAPGGVGNSQIVLSLQSPGNSSSETGSVVPSAGGQVCTGDTQPPCKSPANNTPSFSSAGVTSAANLRIFLDVAEPDNAITANSLTLNVYNPTTFAPVFTASLTGTPLNLTTFSGQGNNFVNIFSLDATEAAQLQGVFALSELIGLSGSFSGATGGPDRLFIANASTSPTPTPEPASLAVLGVGLAGAGFVRRLRKRA